MKEAYKTLSELGGKMVTEEDVTRGPKFVIPEQMTLHQAADFLVLKMKESQEEVTLDRTFPFRFADGAVAVTRALHRFFGTFGHKQTMGFWGPNPPAFTEVEVAFGEKIQIPVGAVSCPAIPETTLYLTEGHDPELGTVFRLQAMTLRKHRPAVEALFGMIEQQLREDSIYKGRAIDAAFNFLDLTKVDPERVVYAEETFQQIEASLFVPIRYPEQLREAGVPLKQAVLLAGTYGVGKTLLAYLTGQECEKHGFTFIQVRPNRDDIQQAIQTAAMYSPAVVFFEDLDTIADSQHGTDHISGLLELFDGVRAKGREVMVILTTNHPEKIHKGMMRPGRLDAVIEITPPDKPGLIRLCKTLIPASLLGEITDEEWNVIGETMEGYLPAFVHEACKRAIKYALPRNGGRLEGVRISGEDMRRAAAGLRSQYDRMLGAKAQPERESLGEALERTVAAAVKPVAEAQITGLIAPKFLSPEGLQVAEARSRDEIGG